MRACAAAGHDVPEPLRHAALREGQQQLLLLLRTSEVVAMAAALDIRVMLLKGTAEIGRPTAERTGDVDVLVAVNDASRLDAALRAQGWQAPTSPCPDTFQGATYRRQDDPIAVDLHLSGKYWSAELLRDCWAHGVPHPVIAGAWMPAAPHKVWMLLLHGVLQHPERQGALREMHRLRRLALALSDSQRQWVLQQLEGHSNQPHLAALWTAATAPLSGIFTHRSWARAALLREVLPLRPQQGRIDGWRHQLLLLGVGRPDGWHTFLGNQLIPRSSPYPAAVSVTTTGFQASWWWAKASLRMALVVLLLPTVAGFAWRLWRSTLMPPVPPPPA
jgi:hypothetical protein